MSETVRQTVIGLLLAAATGGWFYLKARQRYTCPHCGRRVRWRDLVCPHCGDDMHFRHRVGPPPRDTFASRWIFRQPRR